ALMSSATAAAKSSSPTAARSPGRRPRPGRSTTAASVLRYGSIGSQHEESKPLPCTRTRFIGQSSRWPSLVEASGSQSHGECAEVAMLDLLLTGGTVVDGTGSPRRRADVGVKDGRIVAIGTITDEAAQTVDATGKVITPGFIDVHTHFDAQVFWDSALTPSPLHGVTTVIGGNCGFTIAPLSADPSDGEYLMRMLARVEGMPLESLRDGVPWSWTSTGEYLDAVEKSSLGVNAGFMVGHSAIRRVVMGIESTERESTPDELAAMRRLLHEGLDAGGFGFSSSWARTHNDADRRMVPSRYASRDEILALCAVTGEHEGTQLEFIPMVGPFDEW